MRTLPLTLTLCGALWLGCAPYVHSPPGRMMAVQTAKTLEAGETGIQLEIGGGIGAELGTYGGAVRLRHGLGKDLDFNLAGSYAQLNPDDSEIVGHEHLYTGRIGLKYSPSDWIGVDFGVAGGGWEGGGFISPDVKVIFAYENSKIVPAFDVGVFTSHPVKEKAVSIVDSDGDTFVGTPGLTLGWTFGANARVPVTRSLDGTQHAFLFGARWIGTSFVDVDGERRQEEYVTGTLGFEFILN